MPPRRGIVKSGNAGNSSKTPIQNQSTSDPNVGKPLFPPGSKYPLSLLHERCQKSGWEKPIVNTYSRDDGWSFRVILIRINKKSSEKESVRVEPHVPYVRPTDLEARHWGATYALYRICNNMQLNRVLPPGPREYWNELAAEHKNAPEHTKWMYDTDPFAARKEVDERQAKAAKKREEVDENRSSSSRNQVVVSGEFALAPEVRMASSLRDIVEEAVKKASSLYPEAEDTPSVLSEEDALKISQQLGHLGFKPTQIQNAVKYLAQPSALTSNLLVSLTPIEATIEYLVLHIPECDLPTRFLPSNNSSNPFITSTHSATDNLKKRWIEDKAIKEAGWPAHVVQRCTADRRLLESWELLIYALGRHLIGEDVESLFSANTGSERTIAIGDDEIEGLGARYVDSGKSQLVMPLFSAPVELHMLVSPDKTYPITGHPPVYITSNSIPAYLRLHLLSCLLVSMQSNAFMEPGEGFCMAAMRILEDEWASIETNGPPDISMVLQHLIISSDIPSATEEGGIYPLSDQKAPRRTPKLHSNGGDDRNDAQVREDFDRVCKKDKYITMLATRQKLPAFAAKEEFLQKLEHSRVVVVVGETGCGKTTQLPQFILDSIILSGKGKGASIVVTQPRRLSAISVAARVSAERLEDGSVGYAIRGESKQTRRTKLLFCTTGVLLRRLGSKDQLQDVTHVVVDEVHERSIDGDFLLLELKELLVKHKTLKVVLMSATINHEIFVKYFDGAPLLTIPGFTHPVTDKYLEDILPLIDYRPSNVQRDKKEISKAEKGALSVQGLDEQYINATTRSGRLDYQVGVIFSVSGQKHKLFAKVDLKLIASVVGHIIGSGKKRGGILIFLPGVQEIRNCIDAIRGVPRCGGADIYPLHANLSGDEQRLVFTKTSRWKIIVATNVAETSITIDDVIYVIDAGKVKETRFEPENNLTKLVETWVSRAAATQRRGRAGRTQPGECYKLYTKKQAENMAPFPVPEILRVPLESVSLTVKVMREDQDVKLFLTRAITPPQMQAMEQAWSTLEELGAVDQSGRLTALGRHMSALPVDLRLAKMLILGTIFQCLGPTLTIAASLSSKPLFVSPLDKKEEATIARARFMTGNSDLLTDLKAYDECVRLRTEGKPQGTVKAFCEENFISYTALREITTLRLDFLYSLSDLGFIPLNANASSPSLNTNNGNLNLIKAVILGGLWPRVARVHLPKSAIKFDKIHAGTVRRENTAKEFKMYDLREGRVFLHPASVLFDATAWKSPFLVYFHKHMTTKVFMRDATEVPLYALLLFGGPVTVNHIAGGVTVGSKGTQIKLKAWPRIGILANQLRRLLDAQLQRSIEDGTMLTIGPNDLVLKAMLALLTGDGLTG